MHYSKSKSATKPITVEMCHFMCFQDGKKKRFIFVEFPSGALRTTAVRHAAGSFRGPFFSPIRCASPVLPTETADRARLKSPNLSRESSSNRPSPDSYDEREDQRDRCGGVRGSVRRLLHLLRPEETE